MKWGLVLLLLPLTLSAQWLDTLWTRSYDMQPALYGSALFVNDDGSFTVAGASDYPFQLCIDADGDSLWSRSYPDQPGRVSEVIRTADGGLLWCGWMADTTDPEIVQRDVWLMRTDPLGELLWVRTYGRAAHPDTAVYNHAQTALELPDGEFLVGGSIDIWPDGGGRDLNAMLMRVTSEGESLWTWQGDFGLFRNAVQGIQQISPSQISVLSYYLSGGNQILATFDFDGNLQGTYPYSIPFLVANSNIRALDGSWFFLGDEFVSQGGGRSLQLPRILRYSNTAELLWYPALAFMGEGSLTDVTTAHDGGLLIAGQSWEYEPEFDYRGLLIQFDADSAYQWHRRIRTGANCYFEHVAAVNDSEYVASGGVETSTDRDFWLVKLGRELPQPHLYLPEWQIDFGETWALHQVDRQVVAHNSGEDTLILSETGNGEYFTLTIEDSIIAPGDSGVVTMSFLPQENRAYSDTLWLHSNDSESPAGIVALGYGIYGQLFAVPGNLNFATVVIGAVDMREVTLYNIGSAPLSIDNYIAREPYSLEMPLPTPLAPGDSFVVQIFFTPQSAAPFIDALEFDYHGLNGPLRVPVHGAGVLDAIVPEFPVPDEFSLEQNYPNPFNPTTAIPFALPHSEKVTISIFDITGRQLETLTDAYYPAGNHSITFNAAAFPSGIYFARLTAGEFSQTRKLILIK